VKESQIRSCIEQILYGFIKHFDNRNFPFMAQCNKPCNFWTTISSKPYFVLWVGGLETLLNLFFLLNHSFTHLWLLNWEFVYYNFVNCNIQTSLYSSFERLVTYPSSSLSFLLFHWSNGIIPYFLTYSLARALSWSEWETIFLTKKNICYLLISPQ